MIYFVKICFHQSNNQDLQTELNTGDVFNISSSSLRGRAGGSARCRCGEGRGLVPTSPHRGALSILRPPGPLQGAQARLPLLSVRSPLLWQNPFLQQGSVALRFAQNSFLL